MKKPKYLIIYRRKSKWYLKRKNNDEGFKNWKKKGVKNENDHHNLVVENYNSAFFLLAKKRRIVFNYKTLILLEEN